MIVMIAFLAVVMLAVGRWGMRRGEDLVPAYLDAHERAKRIRVLRRGAITLQLVGLAFLLMIVTAAVNAALKG